MSPAGDLTPRTHLPLEASDPMILALQPEPINTIPAYFRIAGYVITSIARAWSEGDSGPGGRCRLCDLCTAEDGLCVIAVKARERIPRHLCRMFSTVGLRKHMPLVSGGKFGLVPDGPNRRRIGDEIAAH